jgi:hypothetical protein
MVKYFVGHDKGEDIGARDWIWVGKATLYTFRPNSLLQQGVFKRGVGRICRGEGRKLLKMTNYTVTNMNGWKIVKII